MTSIPLTVTLEVIAILEKLEVPYVLVGSLASSALGIPRSTLDSDVVVDLPSSDVPALVAALERDYYVDAGAALEAIRRRAMFNVIHLATSFKVDLYILGARPFDREEFARRKLARLSAQDPRQVYVATAEDLIISKLEWYRMGNEISERQWRDVLGLLAAQGERLDREYLERWCGELGLAELWRRAQG